MRRKFLLLAAILAVHLFMGAPGAAHEQRTPIIVDTDMALDDVRAIILLLSSPPHGRDRLRDLRRFFVSRSRLP
jgi:hypothetical protein